MDFDDACLGPLGEYGVKTAVEKLPHVPTTPGEIIRYEGEKMVWDPVGWDGWADLCAWAPPLPAADAYHVLVEGGGDGEVRAVQAAMAAAAGDDWEKAEERPLLSIEPIMHEVTRHSVASLAKLTEHAAVCSPDLLTALRISRVASFGRRGFDVAVAPSQLPRTKRELKGIARSCANALRLPPSATLAIRDGAHGSYLLTDKRLTHVPAVAVEVVDPTGAGNAYGGALCARLARGDAPAEAAEAASAVGAAFCAVDGWPGATRAEWVVERAAELRARREAELQVQALARNLNIYLG